jgi:hypothetical protein
VGYTVTCLEEKIAELLIRDINGRRGPSVGIQPVPAGLGSRPDHDRCLAGAETSELRGSIESQVLKRTFLSRQWQRLALL